jgi:nitrate reductase gamma subunit
MNTFSINFHIGHYGFSVNLFNQFEVYLSYRLVGIVVIAVVLLRARKVIRDRARAKKAGK